MGWSCAAEADNTLKNLQKKYFADSNFKKQNGFMISFEVRREQQDGAIVGSVELNKFAYLKDGLEYFNLIKKTSFKIAPKGDIIRFPKWALKEGC